MMGDRKRKTSEHGDKKKDQKKNLVIPGPGALRDPTALSGIHIGGELTDKEKRILEEAKKAALKMTIAHHVKKQEQAESLRRARNQQRAQAYQLMCKLYVGNIPFEAREVEVRPIFEPFGHIIRLDLTIDPALGRHRGYAFVEYDCPDAAYMAARERSGHMFSGRPLKVKVRPEDHPQSLPFVKEMIDEARGFNRAYVSNVKPQISENDIKNVFDSFGAVRCSMVPEPRRDFHKGYGYIEFQDVNSVTTAVTAMNHFDLVGRMIYIQQSVIPPEVMNQAKDSSIPAAVKIAAISATASIQAGQAVASNMAASFITAPRASLPPPAVVTIQPLQYLRPPSVVTIQTPQYGNTISGVPPPPPVVAVQPPHYDAPVLPPPSRTTTSAQASTSQGSRIVLLTNMVTADEVDAYLEDEIREECEKYGTVVQTRIVFQQFSEQVNIYVEFGTHGEANAARAALNGRFFSGRVIRATVVESIPQ